MLPCKIVGYTESRTINQLRDEEGRVIDLSPVKGSEQLALNLELPDGKVIQARVSPEDFEAHVAPHFEAILSDGTAVIEPEDNWR